MLIKTPRSQLPGIEIGREEKGAMEGDMERMGQNVPAETAARA